MLFIVLLTLSYAMGIALLYRSWKKIKLYPIALKATPFVSIVVAFRNEEKHLPRLLASLSSLAYPKACLEIILVNDHSEDAFDQVINTFPEDSFSLKVLTLEDSLFGKKKALSKGIASAKGEWILTTDADCSMGSEWLVTMLSHAEQSGAHFVFGPVVFRNEGRFLYDFQSIEFASLIGSGAALWNMKLPTMCNGANLLYKKSLVEGGNIYGQNTHLASGDDEFLMHEIVKADHRRVSFVKRKEALVETEASSSWSSFFQQRKRWASKWGGYQLFHVKIIALWVFLLNSCYAMLPFFILMDKKITLCVLVALLIRSLCDGIFLREILHIYHKPFNLVSYVGLVLVYPYYVVVSALTGRWGKYEWKGRKVK